MNKLSKILLAGFLAFSAGSAFAVGHANNNKNDPVKSEAVIGYDQLYAVSIDGTFISDIQNDTDSTKYGYDTLCWSFQCAGAIEFFNYKGGPINVVFRGNDPVQYSLIFNGENEVTAGDIGTAAITFANDYCRKNISIVLRDGASLKIKSGNVGVMVASQKNRTVDSYLEFTDVNSTSARAQVIIESQNAGVQSDSIFFGGAADYYIHSNSSSAIAPLVDTSAHKVKVGTELSATVTATSSNASAINGFGAANGLELKNNQVEYHSTDYKAVNISNQSRAMQGFIQYADASGSPRVYTEEKDVSCVMNETMNLSFNSAVLSSSLQGYTISRSLTIRNSTQGETIYSTNDTNSTPIQYSFTPSTTDLYYTLFTLRLRDANGEVAVKSERVNYLPYGYHSISESVNGLSVVPENGSEFTVRTGNDFEFYIELEDYYDENPSMVLFTDQGDVTHVSGNHYKIENVRSDLDITALQGPKYFSNVKVYVEETVIATAKVVKGQSYTLPTLTSGQIPAGKTFDYWKVGNKANHYLQGGSVSFNESERGELRIEAHFSGLYNLTISEGHFYSDAACTNIITQAAPVSVGSGTYTYFKFEAPYGEVVNGKMLDYFNRTSPTNVNIWDDGNGLFFFEMVAGDIVIEPTYKYVIDEVTAENVVIPVSGEPLLERTIKAPADANYSIPGSSNSCTEIIGGTSHSVYTYDDSNPYHFKNDADYEFKFYFRILNNSDYIHHPDGYFRDGGCQIHIDGLDDSEYEILNAHFTNSSKQDYEITVKMSSVNRYSISVTDGSASIDGNSVSLAREGASVLLVADSAPAGKGFDKWNVTGITLSETELSSSRLLIEMPANDITAEATYKTVPSYTVSFNANGGTGSISDDSTYGSYILPECTFTAPEHMHFVAWEVNDEQYDEYESVVIEGNTVIKAIWAYDNVTISFNANGGSGTMAPVEREYGSSYTLPENGFTAPAHYNFAGWSYTANGEVINTSSITLTGDVELFAKWEAGTCTVTFAHSEGASGSMDSASVTYGENYVIPAPTFTPISGYEFKYWSINGAKIETTSIQVTDDITLTAVYGEVVTLESITLSGTYKTEFKVGDTFNSDGLVVTAHYSDSSSQAVTGYELSGYDMNTKGEQTVTVSYTEGGVTRTATYTIIVSENEVTPSNNNGLPTPVLIAIIAGSVVLVGLAIFLIIKFAGKKK